MKAMFSYMSLGAFVYIKLYTQLFMYPQILRCQSYVYI